MITKHDVSSKFLIDWLSVTHRQTVGDVSHDETAMLAYANATAVLAGLRSHRQKAHSGYNNALLYENGAIAQWHPARPEMGTNYTYTGSALKSYDAFALMKNHVRGGGRVRRLDITIDTNAPLNIWRLKRMADKGKMVSRSRTEPRYINEKGETLYVGAKTSDEMVRIYDKRAEQNLPDTDPAWFRIELKLTDDKAINAAHAILNEGVGVIARFIRGYVDFPNVAAWSMVFDNIAGLTLTAGEKKLGDTKAWLMTQVASALTRIVDDDESFLGEFLDEVYYRREHRLDQAWVDEG